MPEGLRALRHLFAFLPLGFARCLLLSLIHISRLPRHWEALPPAQQVRLAVGWLRRVRQSAPSETARESLTPLAEDSPLALPLAQSYDRARYSHHPVGEAEAAQARELVRTARRKG